jgi:drug/metabolite transporter (DMT)-like permease
LPRQEAAIPTRTIALFYAVIICWGINWPIIKVGLDYMPPLYFAVGRMTIGAMTLFAILLAGRRLTLPKRQDLKILFSEAILHMAAPIALMNLALEHVAAGRSAILSFTTPLWVAPAGILLLGERLSIYKAIGLALGFLGLAVLFNPLGFDWGSRDTLVGNGFLLLAALTWAIAIIVARTNQWTTSPLQLSPWQMLIAAAVIAPFAAQFERLDDIRWSGELAAALAFNGFVASAFGFWGALSVARSLPVITTSMGFLGVPVVGVAVSAITLDEPLTLTLILGMAFIIGGIVLVNWSERKTRLMEGKAPPSARSVDASDTVQSRTRRSHADERAQIRRYWWRLEDCTGVKTEWRLLFGCRDTRSGR